MECINCGIEISDKAKYCSDKCRKAYSRKSDKPGQINPDKTKSDIYPDTFKDAVGHEHKTDYEGRLKDFLLLLDWAEGKGNGYQYRLGRTALRYTKSRRIDLQGFLGLSVNELKPIQSRFNHIIESQLAKAG